MSEFVHNFIFYTKLLLNILRTGSFSSVNKKFDRKIGQAGDKSRCLKMLLAGTDGEAKKEGGPLGPHRSHNHWPIEKSHEFLMGPSIPGY